MLRIVGVQRSATVESEFVLLQNQSAMRIGIRGHALLSERDLLQASGAAVLNEDEIVPPSAYIMVRSGSGRNRWGKSKDGALVYHLFLGASRPLWPGESGALHLLHIQHSYSERREPVLMVS
ncbi:MAG TPA: hypothetical protein PLO61_04400 [Fimbriimonadaceae bacterium]|nr:hypothetical protein [Fimbriimonadaceae bacterium]HRJ32798.1 hypothetical protein [Fimbriimonadaceae bacterium]